MILQWYMALRSDHSIMPNEAPQVRYRESREGLAVSLTVEVRSDGLHCWFSPLHRSVRHIPFENVAGVSVVRYEPSDYGGWSYGIRIAPSGDVAYRLSDDRGVEFHLTDGRKLFVGSETPAVLAGTVRDGIAATTRP